MRIRLTDTIAVLALGLLAAPLTDGHAAPAAPSPLIPFAQLVLEQGRDAQLPPHLSKMLALNDGSGPTPVRQVAIRVGTVVHDFNVVASDHRQRVLFTNDELSKLTKAYALRPDGTLRLALQYRSGGVSEPIAPAAAAKGFQTEVRFWSDYGYRKLPAAAAPSLKPFAGHRPQTVPNAVTTHP